MKKIIWLFVLALMSAGSVSAQQCVADTVNNPQCRANDVRIEEFAVLQVLEDCPSGIPGEAEAFIEVLISAAGSPDRYDLGFFIALDGGSAKDGNDCLHAYLAPPLTPTPMYGDANSDGITDILNGPWWDADSDQCGDILGGTQVIRSGVQLRFACVDLPDDLGGLDGMVDISACASWDLPNSNAVCNGVFDAVPGTPAKCGCTIVDVDLEVPVELESFSIER